MRSLFWPHKQSIPSIQKTLRAQTKILRNHFLKDCANLLQSIARNNSWEIVFGAIAQLCCCSLFLIVFVTCLQEPIGAMAMLSLRQNISEELFLAGLRETRVIIARSFFEEL